MGCRVTATPLRTPLPQRRPVSGAYTTPRPSPSIHSRSFTAATPRTLGTPLPNGSAGSPAHTPPSGKGGVRAPSTLSRMKRDAPFRSPSPPPQHDDDAAMPDYGGRPKLIVICLCLRAVQICCNHLGQPLLKHEGLVRCPDRRPTTCIHPSM